MKIVKRLFSERQVSRRVITITTGERTSNGFSWVDVREGRGFKSTYFEGFYCFDVWYKVLEG